jgi:hypothetical protein
MAFKKTSGTIVIDATLTELGREKMAKGEFLISKFALGDDEIDYSLFDKIIKHDEDGIQATKITAMLEAYSNKNSNITYGPTTHISQNILYLPELKVNNRLSFCPDIYHDVHYLSVNDETSEKINLIFANSFKYLESSTTEKSKLVIESGLNTPEIRPELKNRDKYLLNLGLLDQYSYVMCDARFIDSMMASDKSSKFQNFPNGDYKINFETLTAAAPTSHNNGFRFYRTYICNMIPNLMTDYESFTSPGLEFSNILGPRGTVMATNYSVVSSLRTNSDGERDKRWTKYGEIDQVLFSEEYVTQYKFDYIETTIYIVGAISHASIQVPVRLLRYSGT